VGGVFDVEVFLEGWSNQAWLLSTYTLQQSHRTHLRLFGDTLSDSSHSHTTSTHLKPSRSARIFAATMLARLAVLSLLLAVCAFFADQAAALTIQVEPKAEECFYADLLPGKNFKFEFEVIRGGLLDVNLRVIGPNEQRIQVGVCALVCLLRRRALVKKWNVQHPLLSQ
jgi:hypothetical protein